jgi:hypothetical protein
LAGSTVSLSATVAAFFHAAFLSDSSFLAAVSATLSSSIHYLFGVLAAESKVKMAYTFVTVVASARRFLCHLSVLATTVSSFFPASTYFLY